MKSRASLFSLGVLLLLSVWDSSVRADTYHVSPFGSNTPPFDTYATAAADPRSAVDSASGYGDTVLIHAGTYDVDTAITLPKGLTVLGVSRDSAVLRWVGPYAPQPRTILTTAGDHAIERLAFVNAYPASVQLVSGIRATASRGNLQVFDCFFSQAHLLGTSGDTIEFAQCEFVTGQDTGIRAGAAQVEPDLLYIHHCTILSGEASTYPTGMYISGVSIDTVIISDNVVDFAGVGAQGQLLACNYGAHPLIVRNNLFLHGAPGLWWNYTEGIIENNTILYSGSQTFPWPLRVELNYYQELTIRNNVIVQGMALPRFTVCSPCGPGARIDYTYNAFWPAVDSFYLTESPAGYLTVIDSANFNAYPMFADDSLYRLQHGSPLIDAGDPSLQDSDETRSDVGWTGGPGGISYQYPELAPAAPESLWVNGSIGVVDLVWKSRPESDLASYRMYRGTSSGFWSPGLTPHREIGPGDTTAADTLLETGGSYFYVVTAVDSTGLESNPSPEASYIVSGVFDDPASTPIPRTPYIARVYPNPFNAATTMDVYIPDIGATPAPVRITLFDVTGRMVGAVYEGRLGPGMNSINIAAVDRSGEALASGVYLARLRVWNSDFGKTVKILHLK